MKSEVEKHRQKLYAPVVIPTCNRYQHLKECVESLASCTYAEETELYISVDYPPNDNYVQGWKEVTEYVQSIRGFKNVHFWLQESNLGAGKNGTFLVNKVFEESDYLIFTEDDNVFAPAFLDYMNQMLIRFEKDPQVLSVSGFSLSNFQYSSKIFKSYTFMPWGNGKWKDKWNYLQSLNQPQIYEEYSKHLFKNIKLYLENKGLFCTYVTRLTREIHNQYMTDSTQSLLFYLLGCYSIYPTKSLVRNIGFDGSGLHCVQGPNDIHLDKIELDNELVFHYDDSEKIPVFRKSLFPIQEWVKKSSKLRNDPLTYLLYHFMGKEKYGEWRKRKGF